jgi:2-oxoglutarate ferredoxin oxidoreductase subunit beta
MIQFGGCSLLGSAVEDDDRSWSMQDYEGAVARWCPGCGDHAVLTAVQRLLEDEQLPPEQTVFVSGIGCSSRFPHYLSTYGFHGLHGRALPVATGVRVRGHGRRRLLLDRWRALAAHDPLQPQHHGHHARQRGLWSHQEPDLAHQPAGAEELHTAARGVPAGHEPDRHYAGHQERLVRGADGGLAAGSHLRDAQEDPNRIELLLHPNGIGVPELEGIYKNHTYHDPSDLTNGFRLAQDDGRFRLGLFYQNENLPVYEEVRAVPAKSAEQKLEILNKELDRYAV